MWFLNETERKHSNVLWQKLCVLSVQLKFLKLCLTMKEIWLANYAFGEKLLWNWYINMICIFFIHDFWWIYKDYSLFPICIQRIVPPLTKYIFYIFNKWYKTLYIIPFFPICITNSPSSPTRPMTNGWFTRRWFLIPSIHQALRNAP